MCTYQWTDRERDARGREDRWEDRWKDGYSRQRSGERIGYAGGEIRERRIDDNSGGTSCSRAECVAWDDGFWACGYVWEFERTDGEADRGLAKRRGRTCLTTLQSRPSNNGAGGSDGNGNCGSEEHLDVST